MVVIYRHQQKNKSTLLHLQCKLHSDQECSGTHDVLVIQKMTIILSKRTKHLEAPQKQIETQFNLRGTACVLNTIDLNPVAPSQIRFYNFSCFAIFFHPSNTMPKELKSMFMRMPLSPRNHNGKNVAYKHQSEGALRGPLTCDAHPIESHPIPERQKNKQERR